MKPVAVFRHVPHEGPGLLGEVLTEAGLELHTIDMFRAPPAEFDPLAYAGLVIMGGPMNIEQFEQYPWLAPERVWIAEALEANLPVMGICLGCQLVAAALGAQVRRASRKEIGWLPVQLTPQAAQDPLLVSCGEEQIVFHWHGDTYDLPEDAVRLAGSDVCPQQAFRWGDRAWGLQFHLEITGRLIDDWLAVPGMAIELSETADISTESIRQGTRDYLPQLEELARQVFRPFAQLCLTAGET